MNAIDAVIETLHHAWAAHTAVDASALTTALPTDTEAYRVQAQLAERLGWFGHAETPRHWKSGGASRTATLTHAPLPPAGVWASPADASAWPFVLRYVEAEIALRLGQPVDAARAATLDRDSAVALIDAMTVSIEIVDSRWQQAFAAPALLRLADLQSHGALVLGEWVGFDAARDWTAQPCHVQIGSQEHDYRGTHSCADPAWVLPAWLRHATRDGAVLSAGTVVTTGTWCGALEAKAGDAVEVRFEGVGRASVQL